MYIVKFCYDLRILNGKSFEMKCLWPNLSDYLAICLEGLRKITKIIIKKNQCPGRDMKLLSPNSNQKRCSMNQFSRLSFSKVLLNSRKSGAFHPTAQHHTPKTWILKNKDCTDIGIQRENGFRLLWVCTWSVSGQKVTYFGTRNISALMLQKYFFRCTTHAILITCNFFHSHKS